MRRIPGTSPTVESVMARAPRPKPDGSFKRRMAGPRGVVVGQRLTHAHQDDVGDALIGRSQLASIEEHLGDDLTRRQVALEAALTGGAERTAHRAAGLGADAQRVAVRVVHEHRLDLSAVRQREEHLARLAVL